MTAWTMNAVSAAEPRVCPHEMSCGTLRKRKYLTPPMSPERPGKEVRSSSQFSG